MLDAIRSIGFDKRHSRYQMRFLEFEKSYIFHVECAAFDSSYSVQSDLQDQYIQPLSYLHTPVYDQRD